MIMFTPLILIAVCIGLNYILRLDVVNNLFKTKQVEENTIWDDINTQPRTYYLDHDLYYFCVLQKMREES